MTQSVCRTILASALLSTALAFPLAAQEIGTVASSEPTLRGTPPGAATRALALGTDVVQDETVESSATGRGQLLFLDQTTLSLAPNTTIVLDRFVFDPSQGTGEIGLRLSEGALRFIGGTITRDTDAIIETPTSTIGIRGSSALILHIDGQTIAIFIAGNRLCVSVGGSESCTTRPGGVVTEDGYQGRVNPEYLSFVLGLIDGAPTTSAQGTFGSGAQDAAPPGSDPVSTTGAQFDEGQFEDSFTTDEQIGLITDTPSDEDDAPPIPDDDPGPDDDPVGTVDDTMDDSDDSSSSSGSGSGSSDDFDT